MKKIEINAKPGLKGRYPIFTSAEALYMYMAGEASVASLGPHMVVVEIDGITTRRAFVEWAGIEPAPHSVTGTQRWMRIVRGVVESGPAAMPKYEPFYGWVHPDHFKMEDWVDATCVCRRCDDDTTVDIDTVFSHTRNVLSTSV